MNLNFLDFEQPIAELEAKIEELRRVGSDAEVQAMGGNRWDTSSLMRLLTKP